MCGFLEDSFIYFMGKFLLVWFKIDIFVMDRGFSILYVLLNFILIGIVLFNCCIILIFFGYVEILWYFDVFKIENIIEYYNMFW